MESEFIKFGKISFGICPIEIEINKQKVRNILVKSINYKQARKENW